MKKLISCTLALSMMCSLLTGMTVSAENIVVGDVVFTHQNVVGSQTCYEDDTDEKEITSIPDVIQGMRINQPVFRAYLDSGTAGKIFTVNQMLKDRTVLNSEEITASAEGVLEFKHVRNCEIIEVLYSGEVVASLDDDIEYVNGVAIISSPVSYQIYQRDENDEAEITFKGNVSGAAEVTVEINGNCENASIENNEFTYTATLSAGLYDITLSSDLGTIAEYEQVGIGDIWVAAGQSNMTDMGALTDGFDADADDSINENMHILYAEDCMWQQMSHPAGEGRFFKTGIRTSPVTSFAREIAASEGVPVGIVQSSVGGTNIYQWVRGVRDSDANSGYLMNALKACFDKMPSTDIKGVLWYQGCNDAMNENYAYNYKNLQQKVFDELHGFFGENTPIITTQLNDANQDSNSSQGYYDAWSYVKDVQRQNEELYDNVYVVGTGELELGDTIHNSASANVKLGKKWANAAKNIVYGDTTVDFRQPTIDTAEVTGTNEITLTFRNTDGLKTAIGTKRIGITNSPTSITLGDLAKEFVVRQGGSSKLTSSNAAKGTELTIINAEIKDNTKVILTTSEELTGTIAVDCMYGKRFAPTLVDSDTNESALAFYNVIAQLDESVNKNTFGSEYALIKTFDTTSLSETAIGDTGFKLSTSSKTYNNAAVMDNGTKATDGGYYPYGGGLVDRGYYLFIGAGGNGNVSATLTLPQTVSSDKYIEITYAKPYATNNGTINRSAGNTNTMTIGSTTIDVQATCDYDEWYTEYVEITDDVSAIDITLGSWSAIAISSIEFKDAELMPTSAPTPEPTATPEPDDEPIEDTGVYTFGDEYRVIKDFTTSALSETVIEGTGLKISTSTSNYNNVVVRDKSSTNSGYFPYGSGLSENGYYLFIGSGGNSNVNASLDLPDAAEAGKYIKITYAKPKATNNGSTERSAVNSENTFTIGNEIIDLQNNCEFDKWYTSTVKLSSDVSSISFKLGKWSAAAVSKIEILDSADTMELTAENDITHKYITPANQTVGYTANVYNSITTLMDDDEIISKGTVDSSAEVTYSVNGYSGVSIDNDGLLTVTPQASPGEVAVSAQHGDTVKTLKLTLEEVSDADGVVITGDELVKKGETYKFKALPTVGETAIPERETVWSIEGDAHGCTIENGTLTVPSDAVSGNITIKAELSVSGSQISAGVTDTFTVTIKDDTTTSPYSVTGVFLKNCIETVSDADGVDGVILDADGAESGYSLAVKAMDKVGIVISEKNISLNVTELGVQEIKADMEFKNAASVKAYILNQDNEIVSEIYKTDKGNYKNVPLVADWITGAKSGLGMGAGIIAPQGVPYGIDPELVNVSELNVKYTYDSNYPTQTVDNVLWYKTGAYLASANGANNSIYARDGADWEQKALPIGNGYMGGMLFGLPDKDQIQFNEETFWAAGYRGTQTEVGSSTVNKNMSEGINGYMSVGNIFVDFNMPNGATVNNYYRDLNLDESVAHVQYEYNGVKFNREYFASYPKEVLVFRYTADEAGALSFDVNPVSMHPGEVTVNNGEITIIGKLKDSEPYSSGGNAAWNQESDLEYCTKIKVIADDGTVTDGYNSVNVSGATGVTVLVTAATDYDPNQFVIKSDGSVDMTQTPYKDIRGVEAAIEKATSRMNGAAQMSYADLKAEHIADYKSQFGSVRFSLTDENEVCQIPTDELQSSYGKVVGATVTADGTTKVSYDTNAYKNLNKHLEELHYNYARYLMISSSRSTTMPATLQGKWCQSVAEIWGSCYCININMEMNYWFAGGANLTDSGKSLVRWFNSQIPAGRITAKNMYKVTPKSYKFENGKITFTNSTDDADDVFIMHTKQAIMGTTDMTGSTNIQSPGNTAWLMYNLWDLYQTTGDKELLEEDLYPIMRKVANFYTQYLYTNMRKTTSDTEKYPDGYYYTTWAGRSPEQGPTHEGIKYDLQLVAGMYDYTIKAAEIIGVDTDKVEAWKEIRNHLEIPVELGDDGQIKEWAEETTYNTDANGNALGDPVHRHISHLVGLYPGTLINRDTPELLEGAKIVLEKRGDDSTGWSCSNKFLLWARTLEGDKALELFRFQLAKKTYSNLFDTHAPFQIDGNFGSAAGVMELLMQSHTGDIYILPALPKEWDKGEISGIKAKNGATVDIKWSDNKVDEFTITPAVDGDLTIGYDKAENTFTMNGMYADFKVNGEFTIEDAKAGTAYTFTYDADAKPTDKPEIVFTDTEVYVSGAATGQLVIAGYNENGAIIKTELVNGYKTQLDRFSGCKKIKAFLWSSIEEMKPICDSEEYTN